MSIDTEQFRTALLEERARVGQARRTDDEIEELAAPDNHPADAATATLDREIDDTLEENSAHVLGEIDAALKRIDDGTYGRCANCGAEIPAARLEAYPWASLCIGCKREAERS